jgi:Fe-S-cluster containining protein
MISNENLKKYIEGEIKFSCLECGTCCAIGGYVFISKNDVKKMAEHLGMDPDNFFKRYVRKEGNRLRLNCDYDEPCVMQEDNKCAIYPVRPNQCKTFPAWLELIKFEENLLDACTYCRGLQVIRDAE